MSRYFSLDDIDPDTGWSYGELIALAHAGIMMCYVHYRNHGSIAGDWAPDDLDRKALGRSEN